MSSDAKLPYEFVRDGLCLLLTRELISYVNSTLSYSEVVLRERSALLTAIARHEFSQGAQGGALTERLTQCIQEAGARKKELLEDVGDITERAQQMAKKGLPYDADAKIERIEGQLATIDSQVAEASQSIAELRTQHDVFYVVAPVRTEAYTGVRLVLPIDAQQPTPQESLIDAVYAILNVEVPCGFQQEAFDDCSLDQVVPVVATTVNGRSYHALDIKYAFEDDATTQELIAHLVDFISGRLSEQRVPACELAYANLTFRPFVFPFRYASFVQAYVKEQVNKEVQKLADTFINYVWEVFEKAHAELPDDAAEKLLDTPVEDTLFCGLAPYRRALEELVESHKLPLFQRFYAEVLKTPYQLAPPLMPATEGQWIEKDKILPLMCLGAADSIATRTYANAVQCGALRTKREGDTEFVSLEDFVALPAKIAKSGIYVRGVYDEPVITLSDLAHKYNLEKGKLLALAKSGKLPMKDSPTLHPKSIYVFRVSDIAAVNLAYQESDVARPERKSVRTKKGDA